jgi:hypothetical protein
MGVIGGHMRRIFSAIALAFLIYNFSVSSIRATTYSYVGQTLSGFLTSGPERPDAVKGDQRSPDAMDLELRHPCRSLSRRTCGHHVSVVE